MGIISSYFCITFSKIEPTLFEKQCRDYIHNVQWKLDIVFSAMSKNGIWREEYRGGSSTLLHFEWLILWNDCSSGGFSMIIPCEGQLSWCPSQEWLSQSLHCDIQGKLKMIAPFPGWVRVRHSDDFNDYKISIIILKSSCWLKRKIE